MLKTRVLLALGVALTGSLVFLGVRAVLVGLLEPPVYVPFCFAGAFLSCLFFASSRQRSFVLWLGPAVGIVVITYIFIGGAHLVHRATTWDQTVPAEAMGLLFWALLTTSWWLVPSAAAVLWWFAQLLAKKD